MNYITLGRKKNPTILFLHGWGGSISSWGDLPKKLAGVGFYCVVIDFTGFGLSAKPTKVYGVGDYALEVKELLNELKIKKVNIIAHSFGGRVAIKLASETEIANKLVLVDSAGLSPRKSLLVKLKIMRYKHLKKKVDKGKIEKSKLERFGSADYKALSGIERECFKKIISEDLSGFAKHIKVPTLIVWGKKDKDTPLYMARRLHKLIDGSSLFLLDAGHFSYLDKPYEFTSEVYDFLLVGGNYE